MVTEKPWERGSVVLVEHYKTKGTFYMFCEEEIAILLPRNIGRAPRIQLNRQHLLFGEYLQN